MIMLVDIIIACEAVILILKGCQKIGSLYERKLNKKETE